MKWTENRLFHEPSTGRAELPLRPNMGVAQQRSPTAGWFLAPMRDHRIAAGSSYSRPAKSEPPCVSCYGSRLQGANAFGEFSHPGLAGIPIDSVGNGQCGLERLTFRQAGSFVVRSALELKTFSIFFERLSLPTRGCLWRRGLLRTIIDRNQQAAWACTESRQK